MACEHPLKLKSILWSDIFGRTASRGQFVKCPVCGMQLALRGTYASRWAKALIPCAAILLWVSLDSFVLHEIRDATAWFLLRIASFLAMAAVSWILSAFLCLRKGWYTVSPSEPEMDMHTHQL
ncbi:MAG: hypothetical protein GX647_02725 [Clostridiales bacterium]|jgi:hypothetical protein|nr:hypothetical protein [Clostridiales bacterium]OPZ67724.1 MAG: hypothetical protein BWY81_01169 [Firmicutes bacterium ADurb.Bin467]